MISTKVTMQYMYVNIISNTRVKHAMLSVLNLNLGFKFSLALVLLKQGFFIIGSKLNLIGSTLDKEYFDYIYYDQIKSTTTVNIEYLP